MEKINDKNYESVIKESELVVIDFGAEWCGGCQTIKPSVEELSEEYKGSVKIVECDIDECEELTSKYSIHNIPTLVFIKGGEFQSRLVGSHPKKTIKEAIDLLASGE